MTGPDFDQIESALSVTLPTAYRSLLAPFPVEHEKGNTTSPAWDDPAALIDLNKALRARGRDAFLALCDRPIRG